MAFTSDRDYRNTFQCVTNPLYKMNTLPGKGKRSAVYFTYINNLFINNL